MRTHTRRVNSGNKDSNPISCFNALKAPLVSRMTAVTKFYHKYLRAFIIHLDAGDTLLGAYLFLERCEQASTHQIRQWWWQSKETVPPSSTSVNQWLCGLHAYRSTDPPPWARGYVAYMLTGARMTQMQLHHQKASMVGDTRKLHPWSSLHDLQAAPNGDSLLALQLPTAFIALGRGFVDLTAFRNFLDPQVFFTSQV